MLPTPIISTETLASCDNATQAEAPKMIEAKADNFINRVIMLAPLARTRRHPQSAGAMGFDQHGSPVASSRMGPQRDE
jgi:hypothetical protein